MSSEIENYLSTNKAPRIPGPDHGESRRVAEFSLSDGTIEVPEDAPEGTALDFLKKANQNPDEWEVTGFRRIEYGNPDDPFISTRFTYKRRPGTGERVDIDDLLALIHEDNSRIPEHQAGPYYLEGATVAIGDMQFGQGVDDPFEAIENAVTAIDAAAKELEANGGADELLIAWLGDHIEGFTSQGGKNTWRTRLTLNEQIRVTRRIMFYAIEKFHQLTHRLVVAAIPGNHGRVETPNGNTTRYDDNFDTEALVAVAEALELSQNYTDVETYVPELDHLSLAVKVGGVTWGLVHGDKWRRDKHWTWWEQQSFHGGPTAGADVLLCGHWHTLRVEEQGIKSFIQVPTLGTDGSYWAHGHGSRPNPGLILVPVRNGAVSGVLPIRSEQKA